MTRIGLFDSGVGGLSILHTLEHHFPFASFVYLADGAQFPFGSKSKAELLRIASQATAFLLSQQVDIIVVACHTASVHTIEILKTQFPVPLIGMVEPTLTGLKKITPNKRVGILASQSTVNAKLYEKRIQGEVVSCASPNLIAQIERGITPTPHEVRAELSPLLDKELDVLILGSTHFAHIQHQIEEELNAKTCLLNPAREVAEEVAPFIFPEGPGSPHSLFTTGNIEALERFLKSRPFERAYSLRELQS